MPQNASPQQIESSQPTLGDVLYPDSSKARVAEDDWVRLVRSIANGDQLALHALYQRSHRLVFTLAMRITASRETAEELTVDVFHDVWRRAGAYNPENGTVLGWILNQARSRSIDRLRFQQRRKRVDSQPDGPQDEPGAFIDGIESRERSELLLRAVENLSEGERQAIEAAYFSELTHAEAAVRLNQPLGTVKTRIRSALQKLRQALAAEGIAR